jgi:hypothetical protein
VCHSPAYSWHLLDSFPSFTKLCLGSALTFYTMSPSTLLTKPKFQLHPLLFEHKAQIQFHCCWRECMGCLISSFGGGWVGLDGEPGAPVP